MKSILVCVLSLSLPSLHLSDLYEILFSVYTCSILVYSAKKVYILISNEH